MAWEDFGGKVLPTVTTSLVFLNGLLDGTGTLAERSALAIARVIELRKRLRGETLTDMTGTSTEGGTFSWGDGIPNRHSQGVEGVGLGEHRNAQGTGGESTLGGLFNQKDQLVHGAIIARRPFARILQLTAFGMARVSQKIVKPRIAAQNVEPRIHFGPQSKTGGVIPIGSFQPLHGPIRLSEPRVD